MFLLQVKKSYYGKRVDRSLDFSMNTWRYQTPLVLPKIDLMQDVTVNQSAMPRNA